MNRTSEVRLDIFTKVIRVVIFVACLVGCANEVYQAYDQLKSKKLGTRVDIISKPGTKGMMDLGYVYCVNEFYQHG